MKKRCLLFFLTATFLFAGCSDDDYDEYRIPPKMYSNERLEQYLLQNFDLDGDGHISIREAKIVREIDCSGMFVGSLECIEFFPELEKLNCSDNSIGYLDLSKNIRLKELICKNSYRLDSLDISKNIALEILEYSGNDYSSLAYLDLRNNINLKKLYCDNNKKLKALDLSNNKKLEDLSLSNLQNVEIIPANFENNLLIRLFCSDVGNLKSLNLENSPIMMLYCSNVGGLKSLNLSGCDKLDSLHLQISNEGDDILNVNLGSCSSLKYLSVFDGDYNFIDINTCVELEEIFISGNIDLKNFDLRNVPNLRKVSFLNNNRLSTLDISENKKLEELHLGNLNNADIKSIEIEGNSSLKKVYCSNLGGINLLSFSGCDKLDSLHCEFLDNGEKKVNVNLDGCSSLSYLNLTEGLYSVPDIKICSKLQTLKFDGDIDISNNMELEQVVLKDGYLLSQIPDNKKLKTLHCITVKDAEVFDLSNQLLLEELYCEGIIPVNIEMNKALKILNIAKNYDNEVAGGETKFVLKDFPDLEEVRCNYYKKISTLEVENCPNLKSLYYSLLYLSGIDTLKITNCARLKYLDCNDSKIKVLDIQKCPDIERINCSYNSISELFPSRFLNVKELNCGSNNLAELDLSKNTELASLSCFLNGKMKELDLRHNENLRYLSCGSGSGSEMTVYIRKENSISYLYTPNCNVIYVE